MKAWLASAAVLTSLQAQATSFPVNTNFFFNDTTRKEAPLNWYNLDPEKDGVPGVSTEKAYEFLKGRPSKKVVVAVIDSGIDIEHEDLKSVIWINKDEIAGNGIDDDKNGYIDDVYGWNFIGGKDGQHVSHDSYEMTRVYKMYAEKFKDADPEKLSKDEKEEFEAFQKLKGEFDEKVEGMRSQYNGFKSMVDLYERGTQLMKAYFGTEELAIDSVAALQSPDPVIQQFQRVMLYMAQNDINEEVQKEYLEYFGNNLEYGYNLNFDPRNIVGDNYTDATEKGYGNNSVTGPDARHGTHVAGIIGAQRNNNLGMNGVADNVEIMAIGAVPDGDERDKDIANAIIYAVDNGAQIINMSFGKGYSPEKEVVDNAVKYAEKKGVLLVHAAGNSALNIDKEDNFPTPRYKDSRKQPKNWLEIGAANWKGGEKLAANFSNFGSKTVDVFSPGVDLYATVPGSKYEKLSGTSMAAPVAAGVAAMLMAYYPELSANDIKDIIVKSAVKMSDLKVEKPGAEENEELIPFTDLSKTGGIINAYEAVLMAEKMTTKIRKKR